VLLFRVLRRLVLVGVLLVALVVGGTAASVWWVARGDDRAGGDVILVLGASQFDGRPSSVLEARLEHARRLYEQGVAPVVMTVGGGRPGDRFTEAQAGARYLRDRGVEQVVPVGEGSDTLRSIEAAGRELAERGWESVVIVTDPWHSLRTRAMARDAGLEARTSPTRAGPAVRTRGTQVRYIGRETAAYLYYRLFGRSSDSSQQAL
jgi:uncharacterized SAM-binding protein YcdF (DUF218 family)